MFRKLKLKMLFALAAFLFGSYYVNAANVYTYTDSGTESRTITLTTTTSSKFKVSGDPSVSSSTEFDQLGSIKLTHGGTLTIVFNTSNFVRQSNQLRVEKGKLILKLGDNYTSSVTIKRAKSYNGYLFYSKNSTTNSSNCILQIQGKSGKKFHIHGNGNLNVSGSNESGWTATNNMNDGSVDAERALFGLCGGQADLDYVIVSDNFNSEHEGHSYHGGAFNIIINGDSKSLEKVTMDNCEILRCFTNNSGSAMYYIDTRKNPTTVSSVTMKNTTIDGCFCNGIGHSNDFGTIRTVGYSCGKLTMTGCTIKNNKTMRNGGGLSWNACMTDYSLQMTDCIVQNNWSGTSGAGLSLDGSVIIKSCEITDNWAGNSGGGIYYTSYSNTANNDIFENDFKPCNFTLSLDAETVISRNHAGQQGGGIRYQIAPVSFHNEELVQAGTAWTVFSNNEGKQLEMSLKIDGTTIEDNEAINGAGICISRTTFLYKSDLEIDAGNINNNTASNHGGGIFVDSDNTGTVYHLENFTWENTVMNVTFGEEGEANQLLVQNNQAKDGGAAYIKGQQHITKIFGGTIGGTTFELGNKAAETNGGAFYINGGNVEIKGGVISHNKSIKEAGGGFYVSGGTISVDNAIVSYNEAATDGGAFYATGGGAITIENNSVITYNKALNYGGAAYSYAGITVDHSTLSYNESKRGGGAYCSAGETKIINGCMVEHNEADYGAGAYVDGGTLTIDGAGSKVQYNTADYDGGGFYVNGGITTMDGGSVEHNEATSGNGGGFYVQGGSATIEGGTVQYNEATNGGGLYMQGTSSSSKAVANFSNGSFTGNVATTAGGGIYLTNYSELNMSGESAITGNRVDEGGKGGGVYKSGETTSEIMVGGNSLQIDGNWVGNAGSSYSDAIRNNVFLDKYDDFLTIDPATGISGTVKVGISIDGTAQDALPTRVIRCTDFEILNDIFTKLKEAYIHGSKDEDLSKIYDDASKYEPLFAGRPDPYTFEYIFFVRTWPSEIMEVPLDFNLDQIDNSLDLTCFMMVANDIRCEAWLNKPENERWKDKPNEIEGKVIADIDMSGRLWLPIGGMFKEGTSIPFPFKGKLEGNGHTISGLETNGLINFNRYGMFGLTERAEIHNLSLIDCKITTGEGVAVGLLIGEMKDGTVSNVIAGGIVEASGSGENDANAKIGGLIGKTVGSATVLNCMVTTEVDATFMPVEIADNYIQDSRTAGGMVGENHGTIANSFANPKIIHGSWTEKFVGGLVGENYGTITNCYVRLERGIALNQPYNGPASGDYDPDVNHSLFGMLAGKNEGTIDYCYYPDADIRTITYAAHSTTPGITYQGTVSENCKIYHPVVRPYTYGAYLIDNQVDNGTTEATTLLSKLNNWVGNQTNYSHWMRTEGSDVNADYPVLNYDNLISTLNYTTVGSKDGINLEYDNSFNEMYGRFKPGKQGCLFIYKTPGETITADNLDSDNHISIYVEEDVALLQSGTERTLKNVFTCQVLKTQDGAQCWHTVASSLTGSKIGFDYGTETQVTWNEDTNPCNVTLAGSANSIFPTDTPIESLDLYSFYEPQYHWVNLKRNQQSHWHMNSHETPITYDETLGCGYGDSYFTDNDKYDGTSTLVSGKGYLASIDKDMLIQGDGVLTNGEVTVPVTVCAGDFNTTSVPAIPANEGTELKGYNLLGNPYQSYLSFARFAEVNGTLWSESTTPSYAVFDAESGFYIPGTAAETSKGTFAAQGDINMHQGFFIVADNPGTAKFDNTMRSNVPLSGTHFRGEGLAYPLVNLVVTDATGTGDVAVVEFDRPEYNSATKMKHIGADGKVYFHHNGDDCALLFLDEPTDHLPVHFEAIADGSYTMTWSTANADFSYLHLIDNMTGMDIDMLTSENYSFTATTDDYKSRFKLMFAYTGIGENEDTELAEVFAFVHDGNLIVNGEGMLEVIDMCGRCIVNTELTDAQNTVSLPQTASGLYVLRLINDNKSKVQKIVVR